MNALQQVTSGQYGSNLSVTFGYNSYGYPTSTVAGTIQNYSYNFNSATGNLNWRQNNKYTGLKEDFYYDGLDRLDYIMKGTTTTLDMAYHYDKGGIFTKSDVGSFLYNNTLKPYALSEISPTSMIIPNTVDSLTYTSFECVKTIQEDPYSASFVYNADNGRAKMEVKQNTTTILTRWYPSVSYIKETTSSATKEYTFIGGDPYTAPVVAITQSGTTTYYNLLRDHLGSITHVVNAATNTLVYQYSFDAWGRMRNVSTWNNYSPGSEPALFIAGRGFTGHEHLPWFNLINMNGRMYDPIAGQFLSPDPFMQNPYLTQNFNRYSYCLNNPLKYVDPSGYNYAINFALIQMILEAIRAYNSSWEPVPGHLNTMDNPNALGVADVAGGNSGNNQSTNQNNFNNLYLNPFRQTSAWGNESENNSDQISGGDKPNPLYSIANAINEFNPIANLWDVVTYAFTGKDRFGNYMSLGKGMLKVAGVFPVGKIGNLAKAESLFTITNQSASKMNVVLNSGKASEFYKILNPAWNGTMPEVGYESFKAANGVRAWIYPVEMSNQGMATIKMMDKNGYLLIFRFADGF